jgi:hypothetical protein
MNSSQFAMSRSDDADHGLGVLTQLRHEWRKIRVAADDDESVDVFLGVAEIQRIDHHADIGRVLARLAQVRYFDQLERGRVHRRLEFLVALPVAIGLLHHDRALQQQALEYPADVELRVLGIAHAERDVLEIAEHRETARIGVDGHARHASRTTKQRFGRAVRPRMILPTQF